MGELSDKNEEYQGIAKPVYDIIGNHIISGGKAVDGLLVLNVDHHTLAFEIQNKLRKLGYKKVLKSVTFRRCALSIRLLCGSMKQSMTLL